MENPGGKSHERTKTGEIIMDDFDTFWAAYPRRVSKGNARKAWMQTAGIRPPLAKLLLSLNAEKKCEQWQRDRGQYVPYPSSWLRAEGWENEHEVTLTDPKEWYETSTGIEAMGASLGIELKDYPHFPAFKDAVMRASKVQPITRAA